MRDTLSTTYDGAQYKYKMNNTFGYNFAGGRADVGLTVALPAGGEVGDGCTRNPATTQFGAEDYSVFSVFARYSVNDGSSCAAVSTTCSTRSR